MGFLGTIFRGTKGFAVWSNALLVEHVLPSLDGEIRNKLQAQISHIFRAGGFPRISDDDIYVRFNQLSRPMQLNLVAIALNDLGVNPALKNEFWRNVRNPFRPDIYSEPIELEAVQHRLFRAHKIRIEISRTPMNFNDLY